MVRGHAVALSLAPALVLAAAGLAGCSESSGIASTRDDLVAAVPVWSDGWVAPTTATVAGPAYGSNGFVDRVVGSRSTEYAAAPAQVARAELRLARLAGWSPTSSSCGEQVEVALAGPDDAVASLVVTRVGSLTGAEVRAAVPHHLDRDWTVPEVIATTCLDGESPTYAEPPLSGAPLGTASDDPAEWDGEDPDDEVLAAVASDPTLGDLGLIPVPGELRAGANERRAPSAEEDVDLASLREVAAALPGWELTWVACGGRGPTRASFVGEAGGAYAVVSAELPPPSRPAPARLRLTLPTPEGPDGDWLASLEPVDAAPCDGASTPRRVRVVGTPAVLPTVLTPVATDG